MHQRTRTGEALDLGSLQRYLEAHAPHVGALTAVTQFRSGYSNLTYRVDTAAGDAYVLRRPPPGPHAKSAHDVVREHGVLAGLRGLAPGLAPAPVLLCTDAGVLGKPWYLMEHVDGVILRVGPDTAPAKASPPELALASATLIRQLARLHDLPVRDSPLAELARPGDYVERQLEGWIRRFERARTPDVPAPDALTDYLRADRPAARPGVLVHNDYKFDNLCFAAGDFGTLRAVLDWEMCTVGDDLVDLGLTLAYWAHPGEVAEVPFLGVNGTHLPGCLRRGDLVGAYADARGVSLPDLRWYFAFGNFKVAAIVQQLYVRYAAGHTRDERYADLGGVIRYLLARGLRAEL